MLAVVAMLVACRAEGDPAERAGTCLGPIASNGPPSTGAASLPAVSLPCFDGSGDIRLAGVRGPALVNLWASWCEPCREELPAFDRFAQRAAGRVAVIGVDTADTRAAGQSVIEDLGLSFPMLYDGRARLSAALGRTGLPITLVVDVDGRIAHVYQQKALEDASLARLVADHLPAVGMPP